MDAMFRKVHETLIECRLCHELKEPAQYEKNRRQCNRCRNRYRERVRDIEKRRAHQRVRDRRYRLKLKQEQAGLGIMAHLVVAC
jgi:transposase-like protein